jgi:outer membrane protein TolC
MLAHPLMDFTMKVKIEMMMKRGQMGRWLLLLIGLLGLQTPTVAQVQGFQFGALDDLWAYADAHSAIAQGAAVQTELARLQSVAAIANTVNLRGAASLSITDNYALPVNFLPAEIFGGPAGTFRQVTFGQQFVNLASITPQLDIINPSTWARVGSARASADLTEVTNLLNRRTLHENIATAYCNLRSVEAQQKYAHDNIANADTILAIVTRRYDAGIARRQDLNNAHVNRANLLDFAAQLQTRRAQHLLSLQGLLGIQGDGLLTAKPLATRKMVLESTAATSHLQQRQAMLQVQLQRAELLANRLAFLPTVSVVAGFNWQQNSNEAVLNSADWIGSRFIGLKLSVPLPTETKLWSQAEEFRINLKMKEINASQMALQESIQNKQLDLELERAEQAFATAASVADLKEENYRLNNDNYLEGIISLDQMLTAFTDWLNAGLSRENAAWNFELQLAKLKLNQSILQK